MIVYHGTGNYSLDRLIEEGPRVAPRAYLKNKKAFSTTTDFEIAALFALRRSPPSVLTSDKDAGVVIEYVLTAREGAGWSHAKDSGIMQDEKEIAILNPRVITPKAVWSLKRGSWVRKAI